MSRNRLLKLVSLMLVLLLAGAFMTACGGDDEGLGDDDVGIGEDDTDVFEQETEVVGDEVFTTYDLNEDAFIDENEYNTFLTDNDYGFTEADATSFQQYDLNDDGVIDANEFNAMIES